MKEALIDTSKNHVGIVIAEGLVIKIINKELTKRFGKYVHMRELKLIEKFSVLKMFDRIFYEKGFSKKVIELYSIELGSLKFSFLSFF